MIDFVQLLMSTFITIRMPTIWCVLFIFRFSWFLLYVYINQNATTRLRMHTHWLFSFHSINNYSFMSSYIYIYVPEIHVQFFFQFFPSNTLLNVVDTLQQACRFYQSLRSARIKFFIFITLSLLICIAIRNVSYKFHLLEIIFNVCEKCFFKNFNFNWIKGISLIFCIFIILYIYWILYLFYLLIFFLYSTDIYLSWSWSHV